MYLTYDQYVQLQGDTAIPQADFNRLGFSAQRRVDELTTGLDGVRKLAVAWPTDAYTVECVMRCMCELINLMQRVEAARNAGAASISSDGSVVASGVVASVSSGTESITYATGGAISSAIQAAAGNVQAEDALYRTTIRSYLDGLTDANGVRLLYGGAYPVRLKR